MIDLDVTIVGGGPGGSSVALALDCSGHRVTILEKSEFPRHHIGESLLARTVPYLERLGVWEHLQERGYVRKPGALFVWGGKPGPMVLDMPKPGYAFQVPRADFDSALLSMAQDRGATVRHRWRVKAFRQHCDRVLVEATDELGRERRLCTRYLVDATGRVRLTSRQLRSRAREYDGPRVAVSAYFDAPKPIVDPHSGRIITEACANGWFWFIPLGPRLASVGLVTDARRLRESRDPLSAFWEELRSAPLVQDHVAPATIRPAWQAIRYANSIIDRKPWEDQILRVGDAAMFVDPLFSTGVHGAVYSGYMAGAYLHSVLAEIFEEERVRETYNRDCEEYFARTRETVRLLYGFHPGEGRFWRERAIESMTSQEAEASLAILGVPGAAIFRSMVENLPMPPPFRDAISRVQLPGPLKPVRPGSPLRLAPAVEVDHRPVFKRRLATPGHAIKNRHGLTSEVTVPEGGSQERLLADLLDARRTGNTVTLRGDHSSALASTLVATGNALADLA